MTTNSQSNHPTGTPAGGEWGTYYDNTKIPEFTTGALFMGLFGKKTDAAVYKVDNELFDPSGKSMGKATKFNFIPEKTTTESKPRE